MKKAIGILLILLLVIPVFAGCTEDSTEQPDATPSAESPEHVDNMEKEFEITVLGTMLTNPELLYENWKIRQTGTVPQVAGDVSGNQDGRQEYADNMIRLFQGGGAPDFLPTLRANWGERGCYADLGAEGYLVNYMDYMDLLDEYVNTLWGDKKEEWDFVKNLMSNDDGALYALPKRNYALAHYVTLVDYNWLDYLGVDELPADWDEFYELMMTARNAKPGTTAVPWATFDGNRHYILNPVANSYGIACSATYLWQTMNGEPYWPFYWDEYLYTLRTLNQMVDDRLVQTDPENPSILGNKNGLEDTWINSISDGTAFLVFERYSECVTTIQKAAKDAGTDADWQVSKVQPTHEGYSNSGEFFSPIDFDQIAISTRLGEEFAIRMCNFINYFASEEGELQYTFGVEGTSYAYDEDGKIYYTLYKSGKTTNLTPVAPGSGQNADDYIYGISLKANFAPYGAYSVYPDSQWDLYPTYEAVCQEKIDAGVAVYPGAWINAEVIVGREEADRMANIENALVQLATDFTNNYLSRQIDDTAWTTYIQDLRDAGYNELYELKAEQLFDSLGSVDENRTSQSDINAMRDAAAAA